MATHTYRFRIEFTEVENVLFFDNISRSEAAAWSAAHAHGVAFIASNLRNIGVQVHSIERIR